MRRRQIELANSNMIGCLVDGDGSHGNAALNDPKEALRAPPLRMNRALIWLGPAPLRHDVGPEGIALQGECNFELLVVSRHWHKFDGAHGAAALVDVHSSL